MSDKVIFHANKHPVFPIENQNWLLEGKKCVAIAILLVSLHHVSEKITDVHLKSRQGHSIF